MPPAISTPTDMLKRRRTKIVATLGPSSSDPDTVAKLVDAGVNVFRLNMSHGGHEGHAAAYAAVRNVKPETGWMPGVLADLSGPKIRVGTFAGGSIDLPEEQPVLVTTREVVGGPALIPCQYRTLHEEIAPDARIMLDDGQLQLRVERVEGTEIFCRVVRGGVLRDRKGMNLPDSDLSAPALTEKDIADARFAIELGVDYLALSFVRRAADIEDLRELLPAEDPPKVIAKIERPEALQEIEAIIDASDGIMVARGDLGVELQPEEVPVVQRELIVAARARNKPCIVATQMLESMILHAQPTRAEVSDVSNAVFGLADAVMLSAETASGRHPVEAVQMMDRIARMIEAHLFARQRFRIDEVDELAGSSPRAEAIARATAQLSRDMRCRAVLVVLAAGSDQTARVLSAERPGAPLIAATASSRMAPQMTLLWGVIPQLVSEEELADPGALARRLAKRLGIADFGDHILTVEGLTSDDADAEPRLTVLSL